MKRKLNALQHETLNALRELDSLQLVALYRGLRRVHLKELTRGQGIDRSNRLCATSLARLAYARDEFISGADLFGAVMRTPPVPSAKSGLVLINDYILGKLTPKERYDAFKLAVTAVLAERKILELAQRDDWRTLLRAL